MIKLKRVMEERKRRMISSNPMGVCNCDHDQKRRIRRRRESLVVEIGEDTMVEILIWLPVKTLLRFKGLSKRCLYLISNQDSYFRTKFISTMAIRKRNRIVGSDDSHPIVLGSIYQQFNVDIMLVSIAQGIPREGAYIEYQKPKYLPTSAELVKYKNPGENDKCPITLDHPTDFLLMHPQLHGGGDIYVLASSNGFLLCSIGENEPVYNYILANPITKEWAILPKPKMVAAFAKLSFICKGEYPLLAMVEYTVVRVVYLEFKGSSDLPIEILSSGDNQWRQFYIKTLGPPFVITLPVKRGVVISSTSDTRGCGRISVYCLVRNYNWYAVLGLVFDTKKNSTNSEMQSMIDLPREGVTAHRFSGHHLEEVDGSVHYIQFYATRPDGTRPRGAAPDALCPEGTWLDVWVLVDNKDWLLKHKVCMGNMIREAPWINAGDWMGKNKQWTVEGFHPLNPKLVFLTIFHKKVWCNVETKTLELVGDFSSQDSRAHHFFHFAYQWPCWPPLL